MPFVTLAINTGQVLYVNTEKNYVAVFLGADRIEDFNVIFDKLYDYL